MRYVGIDPGRNTGLAVWDAAARRMELVTCMKIHDALDYVHQLLLAEGAGAVHVVVEDARQRRWYGLNTARQDRARLQGAGSVKRDCRIWEDALGAWGAVFEMRAPKDGTTKMRAASFKVYTGYAGRTNDHGRDAALLVYGR